MEFDPYEKWLKIPRGRRPPSCHELLGLPEDETDPERIREAAHQRIKMVEPYTLSPDETVAEPAHHIQTEITQAMLTLVEGLSRTRVPQRPTPANLHEPTAVPATERVPRIRMGQLALYPVKIAAAIVRGGDKLLGAVVGEDNAILLTFLRVVLPVCFVVGVVGLTASYNSRINRHAELRAAQQAARVAEEHASALFETEVRSASFERGRELLEEADAALAADESDAAKQLFAEAVNSFSQSESEASAANKLGVVQETWSSALATTDEELVEEYARQQLVLAQEMAALAETRSLAGEFEAAATLYEDALVALAPALTAAREFKAAREAEIARLELAIANGDPSLAGYEPLQQEFQPKPGESHPLTLRLQPIPPPNIDITIDLGGGVTMELVSIPAGSFQMGDSAGISNQGPVHAVQITQPFYLGKYEVTQEQWQAVMGDNPSNFKGVKNPVERVSWSDCQAFLAKLQEKCPQGSGAFRLPTEAEWEYACRAGSITRFCFGDDEADLGEYAWYGRNSGNKTHPVGEKKPNAWGLHDMYGNVWEWCQDWFAGDYYAESPAVDPKGPAEGAFRVYRGGCWRLRAEFFRSADRSGSEPVSRFRDLGFRVAAVRLASKLETSKSGAGSVGRGVSN